MLSKTNSQPTINREAVDQETWEVLEENELFETTRGLKVSSQKVRLPDGREVPDYFQIAMRDFTVIYATTGAGKVITLRQYKHGLRRVALTLPGGLVEKSESAVKSAQRELLEETGYVCKEWHSLGTLVLNGNQRIAEAHLFHAVGASKVDQPKSGDLEEMETVLLSAEETWRFARTGKFPIVPHVAAIGLAVAR